jgi:hypothetical protein
MQVTKLVLPKRFLSAALPIILVALGCCTTSAQEVFLKEEGLWATSELSDRKAAGPDNRLIIRSTEHLAGKISVRAVETDEVVLRYYKQAKTDRRSRAIDYIDLISVSLERLPEYVRLDFRAPNPPPWNKETEAGRVEAILTVPIGSFVQIEATYFDVNVTGPLGTLVAPSSLGRFTVSGITDRLEISTANRRIELDSISGEIAVSTSNASITASNVISPWSQAEFRNDGGDIRIDGCEGAVNIRSNFGRVNVTGFVPGGESSFIRGSSEPIIIDIDSMTSGQLVVSNRHEDVEISVPENINAFFSLAVGEEGAIEATNLEFRTDLVQQDRLNLIAGDGQAEISVSVRGRGNISIRGYQGD